MSRSIRFAAALAGLLWCIVATPAIARAAPDLQVTIHPSASTVRIGDYLEYDVHIRNAGTDPADDVSVTDTLPAGATDEGTQGNANCARSSASPPAPTCSFPSIEPGAEETFQVEIRAMAAGPQRYTVATEQAGVDANPSDDQAESSPVARPEADLGVTVERESPTWVHVGDGTALWSIVVTNHGPQPATGVRLEGSRVFTSVEPLRGATTRTPLAAPAPFTLDPGESRRISESAPIGRPGYLQVEPSVRGDQFDPNAVNDSAAPNRFLGETNCQRCGEVDVAGESDLGVSASATQTFLPGQTTSYIDYIVHARNAGPFPTAAAYLFAGHPAGTTPMRLATSDPIITDFAVAPGTAAPVCEYGSELDTRFDAVLCQLTSSLNASPTYPNAVDVLYRLRVDGGSPDDVSTLFELKAMTSPFGGDPQAGDNAFVADLHPKNNRRRVVSPIIRTAALRATPHLGRVGRRTISVPVSCSARVTRCRGVVAVRRAGLREPGILVASGRFALKGGKHGRVRIGLPRAARALLARRHAVPIQLVSRSALRTGAKALATQRRISGAFRFRAH